MTADRFFGSVDEREELLRSMYNFVDQEIPTKSELKDWIQSNTNAETDLTIETYVRFQ